MDNEYQIDLLQSLLKQIKFDPPGLMRLIEQQINDKKGQQSEISKELIRRLRIQNKKLLEQVALLREQIKNGKANRDQMMIRLDYLVKLNTSLAHALGSCSNCWGENPECSVCSGKGYPGWQKINKRLFNLYVLPTLEKLYNG